MKKIFFFILLAIFLLLFANRAQAADFEISSFNSRIKIEKNGKVNITEEIKVNFFVNRHGIYRTIPVKYKDNLGNNLNIRFKLNEVVDENGEPYEVKKSKEGRNLKIRIGSSDLYVSGEKTYFISYSVERVMNFFDDYDELYWNVTGNEWGTCIKSATAEITLPEKTDQEKMRLATYTGAFGSSESMASEDIKDGKTFFVETKEELTPYEGLTVVVGFPKDIVREPTVLQKIFSIIKDNFYYFIRLLVLMVLLIQYFRYGRDPKGRVTIAPQFEPPKGLTPIEVGTIVDEKIDTRDISATIVDLAVRGYVEIKEFKKTWALGKTDYGFDKKKDFSLDKNLKRFEKDLLDGILAGKNFNRVSELKNGLFEKKKKIENRIYEELVESKILTADPRKIIAAYLGIGIFLTFAAIVLAAILQNLSLFVAVGLPGILVITFGFFMPKKTRKGVILKEKILGFRLYLMKAEKGRIRFFEKDLSDSEKKQLFEKYLPFAMVLGVASFWAKAFEGLYREPPEWYSGYSYTAFSTSAFTSHLSGARAASMVTTMTSAASGGSGFSGGGAGGGFGGGGGGSW